MAPITPAFEMEIELGHFIAFATPVKAEELKAGLGAYIYVKKCREAFIDCVQASPSHSISKLPPEMIDQIMAHLYADVRERYARDWQMIYLCASSFGDARTLGTVLRKSVSGYRSRSKGYHSILHESMVRFSTDICRFCGALRTQQARTKPLPATKARQTLSQALDSVTRCDACTACLTSGIAKFARNRSLYDGNNGGTEYRTPLVLENNLWDLHPEKVDLASHMKGSDNEIWLEGASGLQTIWQSSVDDYGLLGPEELRFLNEEFKLSCWFERQEYDLDFIPQHTTALLIPSGRREYHTVQGQYKPSPIHFPDVRRLLRGSSLVTLQTLQPEQDQAFRRILKELWLNPCSQLKRQDYSQQIDTASKWPQLSLLSYVVDCFPM